MTKMVTHLACKSCIIFQMLESSNTCPLFDSRLADKVTVEPLNMNWLATCHSYLSKVDCISWQTEIRKIVLDNFIRYGIFR